MAVVGISTTTRKIITDLGIEEMSARLAEFHTAVERVREDLSIYTGEFRRAKDGGEDRKAEMLATVSRDNEGKPESFIDRQHKVALATDEVYNAYQSQARAARDNMDNVENRIKVYEGEIRSLQVQMSVLAGALTASAAQTRAKTTASIIGQQANVLLAANL